MPRISDALELLTAQHAQIDDLLETVSMLRDRDALDELADTISAHLGLEQELFYPAIEPPIARDILDELLAEHIEIKRALAGVLWYGVEDPGFAEKLDLLRTLLEGHVAYQEDELFTRVAETMAADQLAQIGAKIAGSAVRFVYDYARALAS